MQRNNKKQKSLRKSSLEDTDSEGDDSQDEKNTGATENSGKDEDLVGSVSTTFNVSLMTYFQFLQMGVTMKNTQQRPPGPEKLSSGTVPGRAHQQG